MSEIIKHVGMIANTGKKCAVAFLQIPEKETHALVIDTEALPDRIHDPLMGLIRSSEAQQVANLGEVLGRRMMPDSGRTVLEELHAYGYLQAQPIGNIFLFPRPNAKINLKEMLEAMGRVKEDLPEADMLPPEVAEAAVEIPSVEELNTPVVEATNPEDAVGIATNMLAQAQLMEDDAAALREKAYKMAPTLKPKPASTRAKPTATKPTTVKPTAVKTAPAKKDAKVDSAKTNGNTKNSSRAGKTA